MAPKKASDWAIRITREYSELDAWVQHLSDKCDRLIAYQHDADEEVSRTHVHLVVIGYTTSDETMKSQIRKHFQVSQFPKTDWVFDILRDEHKAITYASKKDLQAKFMKGYEQEFVAECSAKYLPPEQYSNSKVKTQFKVIAEKPEVSKKRQNDLLDEMIQVIKQNHPIQQHLTEFNYQWDPHEVLNSIIEVLNKHRVIFGRYKVRDYYDTIMSRMCPSKFQQSMREMVCFVQKSFPI